MQGGGFSPGPGYGLTGSSTSAATTQQAGSVPTWQTGGASVWSQHMTVEGDRSEMSHLDSFFASTGWTREDVMVVAASLQIIMWLALLYLEITEE